MTDMMYTTHSGFGFAFLGILHTLAALAVFIGILFLVIWAVKTLKNGQLKTWGMWMVVAGLLVCLLTFALGGTMGGRMKVMKMMHGGMMMNEGMMDDGMSMNGMTKMLQGKTGDEFDKAFIQMMIPHHQGAIDMANAAKTSAKHVEIKNLANAIIASQQKEIDQMRQWQKTWAYVQ